MSSSSDTLRSFVQSKVRQLPFVPSSDRTPPNLELQVMDGIHYGQSFELVGPRSRIAGDFDADLHLIDPDFDDCGIDVTLEHSAIGTLARVATDHPNAYFHKFKLDPQEQSDPVRLPATLQIGDVVLLLKEAGRPQTSSHAVAIAGLCCLLFGSAAFLNSSLGLDASSQGFMAVSTADATDQQSEFNIQQVEAELTERLEAVGFGAAITVSPLGDAALSVSGTLTVDQVPTWREVRVWFDTQSHGFVLQSALKVAPRLDEFPAISMVKLTPTPEILFLNGQSRRIGDAVTDGWRIQAIDVSGVSLERRDERLFLSY